VAFGGGAMAWFYSAIILFGVYAVLGGALAWMGMREIKQTGIVPTHTMRVLKQDQTWIQREAKTQL
jgi:Putative Actinobacterial Holin-X, holin superfamily III